MTPTVTISRELAERLLAASKVCTGQDCPPFHHDLALAGGELRAALDAQKEEWSFPLMEYNPEPLAEHWALDAPASSGWRPIETAPRDEGQIIVAGLDFGTGPTMHVTTAVWDIAYWVECDAGDVPTRLKYLTHWQPLPPPPGDDIRTTDGITDSER